MGACTNARRQGLRGGGLGGGCLGTGGPCFPSRLGLLVFATRSVDPVLFSPAEQRSQGKCTGDGGAPDYCTTSDIRCIYPSPQ